MENELISKLLETQGNITIKDGVVTFEDGTQIDIKKAMEKVSFNMADWRVNEMGDEEASLPDRMKQQGRIEIEKPPGAYGFSINATSPLGHAYYLGMEFDAGRFVGVLDVPSQDDPTVTNEDYHLVFKASNDNIEVCDKRSRETLKIDEDGDFVGFSELINSDDLIYAIKNEDMKLIQGGKQEFSGFSKAYQRSLIRSAIVADMPSETIKQWLDVQSDPYWGECFLLSICVEEDRLDLAQYIAGKDFSWEHETAVEACAMNRKLKAFRDWMMTKELANEVEQAPILASRAKL